MQPSSSYPTKRDVLLVLTLAVLMVAMAFTFASALGVFDDEPEAGLPATVTPDEGPGGSEPRRGTDDGPSDTLVVTPETPTETPARSTTAPPPSEGSTATTRPSTESSDTTTAAPSTATSTATSTTPPTTPTATPAAETPTPEPSGESGSSGGGFGGGGSGGVAPGGGAGGAGGGDAGTPSEGTPEGGASSVDLVVEGDRPHTLVGESNVVPGDAGESTLTLVNGGEEDGTLSVAVTAVRDHENGVTDPERDADTTHGAGDGELSDAFRVRLSVLDDTGARTYLAGDADDYVTLSAVDGSASTVLPAGASTELHVEWNVPVHVGNEIQSDGLDAVFDVRLEARSDQ